MAGFLIPAGIAAAGGLIGGLMGGRPKGPSRTERDYENRLGRAITGLETRGTGAEMEYLNRLYAMDPEDSFSASLTAELDDFDDEFAEGYANQLGGMVGQGRSPSRSGFGLRDAQDTIQQGQRERARIRQAAQERMFAARQGIADRIGQYGVGTRNTALDAISGRLNTLSGQRLTDNAGKRDMWGGILGGVAQGVGAYYGGR